MNARFDGMIDVQIQFLVGEYPWENLTMHCAHGSKRRLYRMLASLLALPAHGGPAVHARPLLICVGSDAACQVSTVQAAIDAAASNPGFDEIPIANNASYMAHASSRWCASTWDLGASPAQ